MSSKSKQLKRQAIQLELLKNFVGDFYQEKKVGNGWLIKMYNGGTGKWQVAKFTDVSYRKYKSFSIEKETQESAELNKKNLGVPFIRPTLESVKKLTNL